MHKKECSFQVQSCVKIETPKIRVEHHPMLLLGASNSLHFRIGFSPPIHPEEQDSLETQRSLGRIFFTENREMPILHKPLAFGKKSFQPG